MVLAATGQSRHTYNNMRQQPMVLQIN